MSPLAIALLLLIVCGFQTVIICRYIEYLERKQTRLEELLEKLEEQNSKH